MFCSSNLYSQKNYSFLEHGMPSIYYDDIDSLRKSDRTDTIGSDFKEYKDFLEINSLGIIGSFINREPNYINESYFIEPTFLQIDHINGIENVNFSQKTNSRFFYSRGSKKEQKFNLNYFQKIAPKFFFTIYYKSVVAPGFFKNQKTENKNFEPCIIYKNRFNSYFGLLTYASQKKLISQNGGLFNDSLLITNSGIDLTTLPVNISDGFTSLKSKNINFNQRFCLKKFNTKDSAKNESQIWLYQKTSLSRSQNLFTCSKNDFFENNYFDSTITNDSSVFDRLNNDVALKYQTKSIFFRSSSLGFSNEVFSFNYNSLNRSGAVNSIFIEEELFSDSLLSAIFYFKKAIDERFYNGSINIELKISKDQINNINFNAEINKVPLNLWMQNQRGNHFYWNLPNSNISNNLFNVNWVTRYFVIGFKNTNYQKIVIINDSLLPETIETAGTRRLSFITNYSKGRFDFLLKGQYYFLKGANIFGLPKYDAFGKISYHRSFFKKALSFNTSITCYIDEKHFANGFMPGLNLFYFQKSTKIGGNPILSYDVLATIKKFTLFLRVDNILNGLMSEQFFDTPHYPMERRIVRIGFMWAFDK